MENTQKFNFVEDFKNFGEDSFLDKNFKEEYLLSIRLSYGEDKQKQQIYKDYCKFLEDLKIVDSKNNIVGDYKKSSSYYFVFKKTNLYNDYFDNLQAFCDSLEDSNKQKQIIVNLLECKNDIYNNNFTIANYEEKQKKIKNFIAFCKSKNLIK